MKNKVQTIGVILGITLVATLVVIVLCAFAALFYQGYTEYKERQLCIKLGGIPSSYACESSKNSYRKINVYTGEEQEK